MGKELLYNMTDTLCVNKSIFSDLLVHSYMLLLLLMPSAFVIHAVDLADAEMVLRFSILLWSVTVRSMALHVY